MLINKFSFHFFPINFNIKVLLIILNNNFEFQTYLSEYIIKFVYFSKKYILLKISFYFNFDWLCFGKWARFKNLLNWWK